MRTRSIGVQLTAWYAIVLTAGMALFGAMIWFSMRQRLITEMDEELTGSSNRFEAYFRSESANGLGPRLKDELDEFAQALPPGSSIEVQGLDGFSFRYSAGIAEKDGPLRVQRSRFTMDGQTFDLEVGASLSTVQHTLQLLLWLLLSLLPVMILIACVGGAWLSKRALRPVKDITDAARALSIDDLSGRLPVPATGDELANLAEVLNSTLARLEAAMKTLSQFVADASHEIRTPLAIIRTTAELALRRARTPELYRASLHEVVDEATRMTQLVEDLLMLARADSGRYQIPLEPVELGQVLKEVSADMQRVADLKQIRIDTSITGPPAIVAGNRAALHRLFLVLIDNAVKYSPREARVEVGVLLKRDEAVVTVRDYGAGIGPEEMPHIFKRFYRADKVRGGEGYGLGLALAESIARAHGSSIVVESIEHSGSLFKVILAARHARLEAVPPAATFS